MSCYATSLYVMFSSQCNHPPGGLWCDSKHESSCVYQVTQHLCLSTMTSSTVNYMFYLHHARLIHILTACETLVICDVI